MQEKSLARKLAAIHADPSGARDFILADAKDADMAFGVGSAGRSPEQHAGEVRFRTLAEYREQIRQITQQGLVDIMLMSASTADLLVHHERLFDDSHVTPAARANDTSDIHVLRHARYAEQPSRPFRTALLDHMQCGHVDCDPAERPRGVNLGLYSITFNNRLDEDLLAIDEYRAFRVEAEQKGFGHFLEVFDPNAPQNLAPEQVPQFVNDAIARTLAGVARAGRPQFLKVVYHGPQAMEELVAYDPHLIVGILGGGAGTTYDAFKLLGEAQKYGARVALFGRKINNAENQLAFVEMLRLIVDRVISPEEGVRAYHGVLQRLGIRPQRKLEDDLVLQTGVMSYSGAGTVSVPAGVPRAAATQSAAAGHGACACQQKSPAAEQPAPGGPAGCGCKSQEQPAAGACGCQKQAAPSHACTCNSKPAGQPAAAVVTQPSGELDFSRMTTAEKLAYNQAQRDRIFGRF